MGDLKQGPIVIGIDQYFENKISQLYLSDPHIKTALDELTESFDF